MADDEVPELGEMTLRSGMTLAQLLEARVWFVLPGAACRSV